MPGDGWVENSVMARLIRLGSVVVVYEVMARLGLAVQVAFGKG